MSDPVHPAIRSAMVALAEIARARDVADGEASESSLLDSFDGLSERRALVERQSTRHVKLWREHMHTIPARLHGAFNLRCLIGHAVEPVGVGVSGAEVGDSHDGNPEHGPASYTVNASRSTTEIVNHVLTGVAA